MLLTQNQKNIFAQMRSEKKSTIEVELAFTKMLVARLLMKLEGQGDFLNDYDKEALDVIRNSHPQDIAEADFEGISLDHWESLNPGYEYSNNA